MVSRTTGCICPSLGRVGAVDVEIFIRYGDDTVGTGSHGVNIFAVLCEKKGVSCHFCEMRIGPLRRLQTASDLSPQHPWSMTTTTNKSDPDESIYESSYYDGADFSKEYTVDGKTSALSTVHPHHNHLLLSHLVHMSHSRNLPRDITTMGTRFGSGALLQICKTAASNIDGCH